jgi:hypothetical protein
MLDLLTFTERIRVNENDCWIWDSRISCYGYPIFGSPPIYVHRWSWVIIGGNELIPGKQLHHHCHEKLCVNPAHLSQLSPKDHKELHRLRMCKRGHPFMDENVYVYKGRRACVTCQRQRVRDSRARARVSDA